MRVGAVDIGTNSTRLLVADVDQDATISEVRRDLVITRLGQGVDATATLADEAVDRTMRALARFHQSALADATERVIATATSAVRDSRDGSGFLATVRDRYRFETRLLSGDEEAELTFRGVMSGRAAPSGRLAIIDVGGGSTEVTIGEHVPLHAVSVNAGCVRATERWLGGGVVDGDTVVQAGRALRALFAEQVPASWLPVTGAIAVAGTATTLAALDLDLGRYDPQRIHGHVVPRSVLDAQLRRLAPMTLQQRRAVHGIEHGRAGVIVGGILVLATVMDQLGVDRVEVSERDLLHGVALLAAGR
jgi:exopolyphosphatase / guanosine-5'-triphosphate,3'-diphosphate pyrophosphatase